MPEETKHLKTGGWTRRGVFGAAALSAAVAASAEAAPAPAETKFEPLANFKFDIENSAGGWHGEAGSAKEATVAEFPVSQSIAGVSMRLKPGAMRELHWHSLAAEWAYMLEGTCRGTVIAPNGQAELADFGPGDTWYFPRGHGHALQATSPNGCHFLLVFDNGHFSEFGTFSITDWIATAPPNVVARTLNIPVSAVAQFPKKEVYIGPGRVPAAGLEPMRNPELQPTQFSHKYRLDHQPPRTFPGGTEYMVTQREFPIQSTMTAVKMQLQPGALRELHWHPHADEWQYFIRGKARVGIFGSHGRVKTEEFGPGHVGFIQQGYGHYIEHIGDEPTELLILFNSPEYQEISLANWLGGNPATLLEDNFSISKSLADQLTRRERGILGKA